MAEYSYEQLKKAARQARAEMAQRGRHVEKRARTKPETLKNRLYFYRGQWTD